MTERFIRKSAWFEWREEDPEAAAFLRADLPRAAVRRMTRLGLLCTHVLRQVLPEKETAVVFATSFGESRTLETFLDSFPAPSPTAFQASIHPAGAQQALIALKRPVSEFYPLAGGADLFARALQTCSLAETQEVVFVAGEEKGTWMKEHGLASERSFAFALHLSQNRNESAEGEIRLHEAEHDLPHTDLASAFDRLKDRKTWRTPARPGKLWEISWK